jgi:hypothetical protein
MRLFRRAAALSLCWIPSSGCALIAGIGSIPYVGPDAGSVEDAASEPEVDSGHDEGAAVAGDANDAANDGVNEPTRGPVPCRSTEISSIGATAARSTELRG